MLVTGSTGATAAGTGQPDSQGTEFWLTFPRNFGGPPELTLFISGKSATSGTVEVPGLTFSQAFTVAPGTVTSVSVPVSAQITSNQVVQDLGIRVTAVDEVTVYGLNRYPATTDAYLGLPVDVLGTDHLVMATPPTVDSSEFAVVAVEDATLVTITPTAVTTTSSPAGTPLTVALNKGQTYQVASTAGDLTGTTITSDHPIAVFGGNSCANVPNGTTYACDHVVEQIPPISTWGKDFLTVPLKSRVGGDTFQMLAAKDNTEIKVNGSVVATLNKGQVHQMLIDGSSTVIADKPILLAQLSNGTTFDGVTSDPFLMLVVPKEQYLGSYTVSTPASGFRFNFINLTVPTSAIGSVQFDGASVDASAFTAIGSSGFSGAQLDAALGSHTVSASVPLGVWVYGFDNADSYGYPGGASFAPVSQVTGLTLTPPTTTSAPNKEVCLTSTVSDQGGKPLQGIRVDIIRTGVNPGVGFGFTDASGISRHCYTSTVLGTDTVTATVGTLSAAATVIWATPTPPVATPPVATPPVAARLDTKVSAVSDKSKFKLQVLTPCVGQFSFRVAKRTVTTISQGSDEPIVKVTWKKLPKHYKTSGTAQTKTINLSKGKYRAVVTGKCGFVKTTTKSVTLKK